MNYERKPSMESWKCMHLSGVHRLLCKCAVVSSRNAFWSGNHRNRRLKTACTATEWVCGHQWFWVSSYIIPSNCSSWLYYRSVKPVVYFYHVLRSRTGAAFSPRTLHLDGKRKSTQVRKWKENIVTYQPTASQRLDKHVPAETDSS
jgi:hypothetical protein